MGELTYAQRHFCVLDRFPRRREVQKHWKMQGTVSDFCRITPVGLPSKETEREDGGLVAVTCVSGVYNRKSILANIPVGQCDI